MIGKYPQKITCVLFIFLSIHCSVNAQQLAFKKEKQKAEVHFSYTWQDHQQQNTELEFSLPLRQVNQQQHKKFIPELAQQYVYIELHKAARKIDPREARVQIQHRGQDILIKVNSRSNNLLAKWQQLMAQSQDKAFDQYLEEHYYSHFQSYIGQKGVKPDHLRYIKENKTVLLPIAQAVYDKLPSNSETRAYVNLVLSWVQSIPYNELENRISSNGAGYLPPLSVVANNQGDCDSKTVLMASLIRSLLPDVSMTMIFLPGHALLGVVLPFRTNEQTLDVDGLEYLLLEPTGPAKLPLGEIANSSARAIAGNMYSLELIP